MIEACRQDFFEALCCRIYSTRSQRRLNRKRGDLFYKYFNSSFIPRENKIRVTHTQQPNIQEEITNLQISSIDFIELTNMYEKL